jgi:hypothetical protein
MLPQPNLCFTTDIDEEIEESLPKLKGKKKTARIAEAKIQNLSDCTTRVGWTVSVST